MAADYDRFEKLVKSLTRPPAAPGTEELVEPIVACLEARRPVEVRWRGGLDREGQLTESLSFLQLSPQAMRSTTPRLNPAVGPARGWRGALDIAAPAVTVSVVAYPLPARDYEGRMTDVQNLLAATVAQDLVQDARSCGGALRLQPAASGPNEATVDGIGEDLFRLRHGVEQERELRSPSGYLVGDHRYLASAGVPPGASCLWIGEQITWFGLEVADMSGPASKWAMQVKVLTTHTAWAPFARWIAAGLVSVDLAGAGRLSGNRGNLIF